jgi:predicted nucleic acid-binding Zn ribbon protein
MAKYIEEQLKKCSKCKKTTKHYRNNTKTSLFMFLVHIVLTVVTAGVWLVLLIVWKLLNTKIGGWKCSEC